jgi:hypothetical protein
MRPPARGSPVGGGAWPIRAPVAFESAFRHAWQRDCFAKERIQPFKQVFRELYALTKPEKDEGTLSRRYAGHQVQPRKALALLGTRGWVHHPEEGVRKTCHDAGVTAWLWMML